MPILIPKQYSKLYTPMPILIPKVSNVIIKHFSPIRTKYGCGLKGILADYILVLKSNVSCIFGTCQHDHFWLTP